MPGHQLVSPPSPASTVSTERTGSPLRKFKVETIRLEDVAEFTMDEVRRHGFVVIDNIVYNVKEWVADGRHPGGEVLLSCLGRDVTSLFRGIHDPRVAKHFLPPLAIGRLKQSSVEDEAEADFIALERRVRELGYYQQKNSYYIGRIAIVLSFLFLALASLYRGCILLGAISLGLFWQQGAFIAHDACHRGYGDGDGRSPSWIGWFIGSVIFGISSSMWSEEHAAHHCFPRRPREDPQFNYLPTFLISRKELPYSSELEMIIARVMVPVQHFVLAPLAMTIGRFNFYLISVIFSCKRALQYHVKARRIPLHCVPLADLSGMCLFWIWYSLLIYHLVPPESRLAFVLLSNCTAGILHVQLLVSHLAVDCFHSNEEPRWFRLQCHTSRNVDTRAHWFWGGLEYQIEHHLFPRLPRHSLPAVQPLVMKLCRKHGVPYRCEGEIKTLTLIFEDLRNLAAVAAEPV
ncbi:hypothetical protein FOZ63_026455 [Perkinsus olseni]|uniref:Cytochrome b5 heme-binding domain-containing protein n=1 Tax=Perkinsus olseni TaxID=32597 RepID=A0A7J6NRN8_PEROL|nr:hypothetical protein FOZ62_023259 [Perkinsus olseni]KAF4753857.1 hypothetical protein FOZ63_026455 [Perkinsus olseni]